MPTSVKRAKPAKRKLFRAPLSALKFSDGDKDAPATRVELIRCGTFYYYGDQLEITEEMLKSFVKNFNDRIPDTDKAIDYSHNNQSIAAGWIKAVTFDNSTKSLWADVQWTPKGEQVLRDKEFRYLSAEFTSEYVDTETLQKHGATLLGAGLTNRPFVKGMEPVTTLSENGQTIAMTPEEITKAIQALQAAVEKLGAGGVPMVPAEEVDDGSGDDEEGDEDSEDAQDGGDDEASEGEQDGEEDPSATADDGSEDATPAGGKAPPPASDDPKKGGKLPAKKKGALGADAGKAKQKDDSKGKKLSEENAMTEAEKKEFDALKAQNAELLAAQKKSEEEKQLSARKGEFDKMLSDGKVVEAQREPFMKQDFAAFSAASQPVKTVRLSEDAGNGGKEEGVDGKDPQEEIMKLSQDLVKEGKAKSLSDGISKVLANPEHKALRERYEASTYNQGQRKQAESK